MRPYAPLLLSLLLLPPAVTVAEQSGGPAGTTRLAPIDVTGQMPGPGLWRVSGDGRELWLLGTQSPLPKRLRWRADEVEARLDGAQLLLAPPRVAIGADVGPVGALLLLPSLLGARKNPDGARLAEVVPPELYARWSVLKRRYLPLSSSVEHWRPLFAAQKLYQEAIGESGLSLRDTVWRTVEKAAERRGVPVLEPKLVQRIEAPREALKEFRRTPLEDTSCFELTLQRLETDLDHMRARAAAWAIGDLEALRALPHADNIGECIRTVLDAGMFAERGFDQLPQRVRAVWLEHAEQALADHARSVAVLPMRMLLGEDGVLAALAAKGYRVEAPE